MNYKFSDDVIARIAQIVQEGMILGIDVIDLMRQIKVMPDSDGESLTLTPEYVESVKKMHQQYLDNAEALKAEKSQDKVLFKTGVN